jgi:DNA-binding response OmpR family regulator
LKDETLLAEELREGQSHLGFSVIAAVGSADEGIAIATRERPDLVLIDIRLKGGKDGIQAAQEIRSALMCPSCTSPLTPMKQQWTSRKKVIMTASS